MPLAQSLAPVLSPPPASHTDTAANCSTLQQPDFPHCSPAKPHGDSAEDLVTAIILKFNRPENVCRGEQQCGSRLVS